MKPTDTQEFEKIANIMADKVAEKLAGGDFLCPNGMDKNTVEILKNLAPDLKLFVDIFRKGKLGAYYTAITLLIIGFSIIFFTGLMAKIKALF